MVAGHILKLGVVAVSGTSDDAEIWDRRRKNLNALIHYKGMKPSPLAREAGLGVNTVNSFLSGVAKPKFETLEKICKVLGLNNISMLDAENPMSVIRNDLFGMVQSMGEDQAKEALEFLRQKYPDLNAETTKTKTD